MRLWWELAKREFRRTSTYRGATIAGVFTNTVFGFIQAAVMLAVFSQRDVVGGFDATDALTYVFVTQGMLMVISAFGGSGEIGERVRSGDVVTDLFRPVDFQLYWLTRDLGRALFHALARGIPPFLVGAMAFDLRLPSPVQAVAFVVAVALANVASFGFRFLLGLTSFWLLDDRGPVQLANFIWLFLSGFILPITFFPGWLEGLARLTPFPAMVQVPVEVFLGKYSGVGLIGAFGGQLIWIAALLGAGRIVVSAATRKVVIQGG
ncbi:MAG: ABC transporter permease [Acidimicrobiales bacterium]